MRTRGACLHFLVVGLALCLVSVAGVLYLRRVKMREHCLQNIATLGSALKAYADQHHGQYPKDLKSLQLPATPACWTAEGPYDSNYQVSADGKSASVCCKGDLHGLGQDQPSWHSP